MHVRVHVFIFSAKIWLYEELAFSVALQYVTWVLYSLLFIMFATGFTHLVSPQAIGKFLFPQIIRSGLTDGHYLSSQ